MKLFPLVLLFLVACSSLPKTTAFHSWVEIDRQAFEHNIRTMKAFISDKTKLCAVMKSDAYGHGMALLIPSVIALGVPCVGFTGNEEAKTARQLGFTGSLVRLRTPTLEEVSDALPMKVEELIGNVSLAKQMSELAVQNGEFLSYHLALNSGGMSRNGIDLRWAEGKEGAKSILSLPSLKLVGIMTHFPVEEKSDIRGVLSTFKKEAEWILQAARLERGSVDLHCANSYATLEVPETHLDMVRPGGALYGDTVPTRTEYRRVMSLKSRVAATNHYPKGNTVNYDRTFTLKRDSMLANIPVGYSDGYRRVFSNSGFVLIRGKRIPIVGRVTMNTLMADITDFPDISSGDEVVLFGRQGTAEITQAELEKAGGTILADLYTLWGHSNPKVLKP